MSAIDKIHHQSFNRGHDVRCMDVCVNRSTNRLLTTPSNSNFFDSNFPANTPTSFATYYPRPMSSFADFKGSTPLLRVSILNTRDVIEFLNDFPCFTPPILTFFLCCNADATKAPKAREQGNWGSGMTLLSIFVTCVCNKEKCGLPCTTLLTL